MVTLRFKAPLLDHTRAQGGGAAGTRFLTQRQKCSLCWSCDPRGQRSEVTLGWPVTYYSRWEPECLLCTLNWKQWVGTSWEERHESCEHKHRAGLNTCSRCYRWCPESFPVFGGTSVGVNAIKSNVLHILYRTVFLKGFMTFPSCDSVKSSVS